MAKLLKMQDYLMLGLAIAEEIFVEVQDPFGLQAKRCQEIYGWIPEKYRRGTRLVTTCRLLKTGYLEKITKNGKPYFRLTNRGRNQLVRDFPILKLAKKKWDGIWTMVVFDIPEKQRGVRRTLREKLLELGFGKMQHSVYISPYNLGEDLREFLVNYGLADQVFVARTHQLLAGNEKLLAEKIWRLKKINQEYKNLLKEWEEGRKVTSDKRKRLTKRLRSWYLEILTCDPLLPQELLSEDWAGERVRRLIKKLGDRNL